MTSLPLNAREAPATTDTSSLLASTTRKTLEEHGKQYDLRKAIADALSGASDRLFRKENVDTAKLNAAFKTVSTHIHLNRESGFIVAMDLVDAVLGVVTSVPADDGAHADNADRPNRTQKKRARAAE